MVKVVKRAKGTNNLEIKSHEALGFLLKNVECQSFYLGRCFIVVVIVVNNVSSIGKYWFSKVKCRLKLLQQWH